MYFDFEDRRPDTPILDRPLTRLEQILLTIIGYLLIVIGIITYPKLPFVRAAEAARLKALEQKRDELEARRGGRKARGAGGGAGADAVRLRQAEGGAAAAAGSAQVSVGRNAPGTGDG